MGSGPWRIGIDGSGGVPGRICEMEKGIELRSKDREGDWIGITDKGG